MKKLDENGPTAKMWIQYFNMVNLTKAFINAERPGDWSAHTDCDMIDLSSKITADEYHKFTKCGYFTMRLSDRYWSGV
ncbi:hypothetical protein PR048_020113 [Dryococelus australis]|uniref:Uncharacterized protein n=1 Tax=Dryococelus australis TaxID=614101 RepID=A0ABQ9H5H7_9NEOP|nr:hypothetical protein PR048_020113 [Dryococelus australis]